MADFGAIFSIIASSSKLALELYKLAHATQGTNIDQIAKSIAGFSSAVKQMGTFIRQDDTLTSSEATEVLDDVLHQGRLVLTEMERNLFWKCPMHISKEIDQDYQRSLDDLLSEPNLETLLYLQAHLDALRLTLGALQQTLYTAQSIIWARVRPAISPQQAAFAIDNEKIQLENALIEQQIAIFAASRLYEPSVQKVRLLTEKESDLGLAKVEKHNPGPAALHRYQERSLASLDISESSKAEWFRALCGVSRSYVEQLLDRWTRLRQLHDSIDREECEMESKKREAQQPTVESDGEEEGGAPKAPIPEQPGSARSPFNDTTTFPVPGSGPEHGPSAPLSPAPSFGASPRSSFNSLFFSAPYSPVSPAAKISNLPIEATAAVQAKDMDDEVALEIPWKLCTRKYYWRYIDNKVKDTNSDLPASEAFANRNSWTEVLASWVCKEAIKEQGYSYTQVQKERRTGRRTEFETCFCIQEALTFEQVQWLVERTVEIYRTTQPPTPPPGEYHATFNHRKQPDREKLLVAAQPPPLERSATYAYPPPPPTVLERTNSSPGKGPPYLIIPTSNLNVPNSPGHYTGQQWTAASSPITHSSPYFPTYNRPPSPSSMSPSLPNQTAPPPRRSRHSSSRRDHSSASTVSDFDEAPRRRHRSRSRRSSISSQKKKRSTVATLAKVGAWAALLDGIVELGVL